MLFTVSTFMLADPAQRDQPRTLAEERTETSPHGETVYIRVYENPAQQRVAASVAVHLGKWRVRSLFLPAIVMAAGFIVLMLLSLFSVIEMSVSQFVSMLILIPIVSGAVGYGNLLLMKSGVKHWAKKRARAVLDGN